ncbi:hypothetical protein A7P25_05815 [Achromobacter xylosoxidans]|nr:hypothetical protein A7P25_05815 [Achromobacter xylosoxidans]
MRHLDRVIEWLLVALDLADVTGVWLYGSYVRGAPDARDVDVMVRFKDGRADHAVKLRRRIEAEFEREFALPLHAIFLSEREFREEATRVFVVLREAQRIK